MSASLVGVGVGPGDPELLTTRARRVLREADHVFAPTVAVDVVGRAESVVAGARLGVAVERLVFDITGDQAARAAAHDRAAARIVPLLDAGRRVAFVTLGDPNVYSTFPHLVGAVLARRPGTRVETVPGVMAFQDLASKAGVVVVDGAQPLHLVSVADGLERLGEVVADPDAAVVVYKGGRRLPQVAARLEEAGRLDGAVFGELLGLAGERVGPVKGHAGAPAAYLATVIVPPVTPVPGGEQP
jgi:precorrin-2/cobalt-factor-2 C20-methyltransferase